MLDKSKLENEDLLLLEEILRRHPDWVGYARPHFELDSKFEILIPPPVKGNPPILIDNFGEGPYVYFGPPHFDFYSLRHLLKVSWFVWKKMNISLFADAIDKAVEKIVSEELIAADWKSYWAILFFFSTTSGLLSSELFSKLLKKDKIYISASWKGTYNHNYNGEWSDPYPEE